MRNSLFRWTTGAAIVLGVAVGGAIVQGLRAQAAPPVYVVVEISDVNDLKASRQFLPSPARRRWPLLAAGT
jgi:hypothetical protein